GSAADPRSDRPRLSGRGRSSSRSRHEHQASDGPRLLSRPAPSPRVAGAWSAHPYQRPHAQGPGQVDRRQEEIIGELQMANREQGKKLYSLLATHYSPLEV